MKWGLFGGTFDPPHVGHLIVAADAADALSLDRVVFLPAGVPPHKRDARFTAAKRRVAMTRAAVAGDARFMVDDRETRREGPSWTVDTVTELHAEQPGAELVLLIGADQYAEFHTWRHTEEIRRLCRVAVLERGGEGIEESADSRDEHVAVTRIDISSSAVRARVAAGRSIRYLVAPAVEALIREHGLYRAGGQVAQAGSDSETRGRTGG